MAITFTIDGYAADPVAVVGSGSLTLATIPTSRIGLGMASGARRSIVVDCDLNNDTDDNYSGKVQLTSFIKVSSGTYSLETIQYSVINYGSTSQSDLSRLMSGLTMSISGSNLIVTATITSVSLHVFTTIAMRGA